MRRLVQGTLAKRHRRVVMRGDVVFREVVRERSVEGSVGRNSRW